MTAAAATSSRWPRLFRGSASRVPAVRLMVVAVWVAVAGWPLAAARLFAPHATAGTVVSTPTLPRALDARAAAFLRVWLAAGQGTESTLAGYLPAPLPQLTGIPPGSLTADLVTSYSVTHRAASSDYAVLLTAAVTAQPTSGPAQALGVRCYQVILTATQGGYNPTQPPAQTSCPTPAAAPLLPSEPLPTAGPDGSIADTVARFLTAYLTGAGDITRYTTPGSALPAVSPASARSVTLTGLDLTAGTTPAAAPPDGSTVHVTATAVATDTTTVKTELAYPLTLTARAGRWEVTAIDLSTHPAAP